MSNLVRDAAAPAVPADAAEERAVTVGPRVDVVETEGEFVVLADMPGVKPGEVDIRFEKGELSVHGRRDAARGFARTNYQRVFSIADTVAADKITAELKAGVLTIRLPKVEAVKPRRIVVSG
jgi:HSP20 family protein